MRSIYNEDNDDDGTVCVTVFLLHNSESMSRLYVRTIKPDVANLYKNLCFVDLRTTTKFNQLKNYVRVIDEKCRQRIRFSVCCVHIISIDRHSKELYNDCTSFSLNYFENFKLFSSVIRSKIDYDEDVYAEYMSHWILDNNFYRDFGK